MRKGHYVPSGMTFGSVALKKTDRNTHLLEGARIFKAGTFKDSMGTQRTWEVEHLEQMIFHYNLLKERGLFPHVPVRADHSNSINNVVGYIDNLYRDGLFLAADIEFTEPEAKEKFERGTFRARSLEVGMYETNDEAQYWPTVMGLAFVDIPAVEGLYSKSNDGQSKYAQVLVDEEETNMATGPNGDPQTPPNGGNGGENGGDQGGTQPPPAPPQEPSNPQTQPQQPQSTASTGNFSTTAGGMTFTVPPQLHITTTGTSSGSYKFKMNGQETTDFAAVQKHIETLEGFVKETRETGRKEFVKALAGANKISAAQLDQFTQLVLGLTDEQFEAFRVAYDGAPSMGLFAVHSGGTQQTSTPDPVAEQISILEERIAMHRRAGMPDAQLKETDSFKKLQELKARGSAA